jgi:DNA-binding CsgD family transcriptional regulator
MRWGCMRGHGSRRSNGRSFGSAGRGASVWRIARALERRNKSGVYRVLALNGGIAPLPRRRAQRALRLAEREEISRGTASGRSMRQIAQGLDVSPRAFSSMTADIHKCL